MILGIIGQAGAGKTEAAKFFAQHGAYIIDADMIVKQIYLLPETKQLIGKNLGAQFLNNDGSINRIALRKHVFENYQFLRKLEQIIWPKMIDAIMQDIKDQKNQKLIVVDCAVLFNAQLDYLVDKVLLIKAQTKIKVSRIEQRDKVSVDQAKILLNLQKKHLILNQKVDYIIHNNGSQQNFNAQLAILLQQLLKSEEKSKK